jgi:hypothetical protein
MTNTTRRAEIDPRRGSLRSANVEAILEACMEVARLAGLLAHEPCREDVVASAEQAPEQAHFLGGRLWCWRVQHQGQPHANLRLGTQGRKLCLEGSEAGLGIGLLAIQPSEQGLLLGDRFEELVAARRLRLVGPRCVGLAESCPSSVPSLRRSSICRRIHQARSASVRRILGRPGSVRTSNA